MANKSTSNESQPPVVVTVLEDLVKRLEAESSIDSAVIARLREALLERQETSVDALRTALFSEEPLP
jgi:hypothetical protein